MKKRMSKLVALLLAALLALGMCSGVWADELGTRSEYEKKLAESATALYEKLMAATDGAQVDEILNAEGIVDLGAVADLLNDEQYAALEAHLGALWEGDEEEILPEGVYYSEFFYPTVNFDNVAKFKPPVKGADSGIQVARSRAVALTDGEGGEETPEKNPGVVMDKDTQPNGDGTYTITLEVFATGEQVITEVAKDKPTDIVLVLDQSGSMEDTFTSEESVTFNPYGTRKNSQNYNNRHTGTNNGNLWHKLDDGAYVQVSVDRAESTAGNNYQAVDSTTTNSWYYGWYNYTTYYAKVNDQFVQVTISRSGRNSNSRVYTYEYSNGSGGTTTVTSTGDSTRPVFTNTDDGLLYTVNRNNTRIYEYSYYYTDENGVRHNIGETSVGADTVFGTVFYRRTTSTTSTTKLAALKTAVTNFVNAVNQKAAGPDGELGTSDDINHRIAVVGFASESGYSDNTELLSISGSNSGSVGIHYSNITTQNYKDVLQSMNTAAGQAMVSSAISALDDEGATEVDLGVEMAKNILANNPVEEGVSRSRVVVVFTDGVPTTWTSFDDDVADNAVSIAGTIKNTYGATVYAVGVFEGADATSAGNSNGTNAQMANRFMQRLSSNNGTVSDPSYYLSAGDAGTLNNIFEQISDQVTSSTTKVNLDEATVVQDIVSDYFELPEYVDGNGNYVPSYNAAGITVQYAQLVGYLGDSSNPTWQWSEPKNFEDEEAAAVQVAITKTEGDPANNVARKHSVCVTGFDFAERFVGLVTSNTSSGSSTVHHANGAKLIIKIPIVPRPGFMGGNNVPSNAPGSGIYVDGKPVEDFEMPREDVSVSDITIGLEGLYIYDKYVYMGYKAMIDELLADAFLILHDAYYADEGMAAAIDEDIDSGMEVDPHTFTLTYDQGDWANGNYGVASWQLAGVNFGIVVPTEYDDGTPIGASLTEDKKFTVEAWMVPVDMSKNPNGISQRPEDESQIVTATATVHVFTPALAFEDSTVDYGSDIFSYSHIPTGQVGGTSSAEGYQYKSNGAEKNFEVDNRTSTVITDLKGNVHNSRVLWWHRVNSDDTGLVPDGDYFSTDTELLKANGENLIIGQPPKGRITYTPVTTRGDAQLVRDGKVVATDYIPVNVKIEIQRADADPVEDEWLDITKLVIYAHYSDATACGSATSCAAWNTETAHIQDHPNYEGWKYYVGEPAFILHVINVCGDLTVSKVVEKAYDNDVLPGDTFTFTLNVDGDAGESYVINNMAGAQIGTVTNGGTFTLTDNQTVVIKEVPAGTYTITEQVDDDYTTYVGTSAAGVQTNVASGDVVSGGNVDVPFTNVYKRHLGNLTISKAGLLEATESAIFKVTGPDGKTRTVAINGNSSVTLKDVAIGSYIVSEENGWTWRYDGTGAQTVQVYGVEEPTMVSFTNSYAQKYWLGGDNYDVNEFSANN